MHEHLGIGGDWLGHRDAGRERRALETENIVVTERPATFLAELLHRERPLLGVEPVDAARRLALHARHWPQCSTQMVELHGITVPRERSRVRAFRSRAPGEQESQPCDEAPRR